MSSLLRCALLQTLRWRRRRAHRRAASKRRRDLSFVIDLRRVNDEDRKEMQRGLLDDVVYRARVKRRMLEGLTMAQLPPLINREEVLAQRTSTTRVVSFGRKV